MTATPSPAPLDSRVRSPWRLALRFFARRFLPVASWLAAIGLLVFIVNSKYVYRTHAVGTMNLSKVSVAPEFDGRLQQVLVAPLDVVAAGDVVALMDDTLLNAERDVAAAELKRLRAELDAVRRQARFEANEMERDAENDRRRFENDVEEARLDLLDRIVAQQTDQVTLTRLRALAEREKSLMDQGAGSQMVYEDFRLQAEALRTKIEENEKALAYAREHLEEARQRLEAQPRREAPIDLDETAAAPLLAAIEAQEARLAEINKRAEKLILRAVISGCVTQINNAAGEIVPAGTNLVDVADPLSRRVEAWIDEGSGYEPRIGDAVAVHSRSFPKATVQSHVIAVSTTVERFPLRLRPNPNMPRYGRQVVIGMIPEGRFHPGQQLDVQFIQR